MNFIVEDFKFDLLFGSVNKGKICLKAEWVKSIQNQKKENLTIFGLQKIKTKHIRFILHWKKYERITIGRTKKKKYRERTIHGEIL